jgi:hypothetical protein
VIGHTQEVDFPGGGLDHEEYVETFQEDGVDGEKVSGQDAAGLGPQELAPRGSPPGSGPKTMAPEHAPD